MAMIMGPLRPGHTRGEKTVFDVLGRYLPSDFQVWPELPVPGDAERQYPDFVLLHPMWGIIVLEVRDYAQVLAADSCGVTFTRRDGTEGSEENPLDQAKQCCVTVRDMIRDLHVFARSQGSFDGPLPKVSYACGVVLACQTTTDIVWLEQRLRAKGYLLGKDDLTKSTFEQWLKSLHRPAGVEYLDDAGLNLVRRALFPEGDIYDRNGMYVGHLDPQQEIITKEGIFRVTGPSEQESHDGESRTEQLSLLIDDVSGSVRPNADRLELRQHGKDLMSGIDARLIRGAVGSGKTRVLCRRAVLLSKLYPEWRILILTYSRGSAAELRAILHKEQAIEVSRFGLLCQKELSERDVDLWQPPVTDDDQPSWIASVCTEVPGAERFDPDFLRDEFNWMKHVDRTDRESYLAEDREGRQIALYRKTQRPIVYQVFEEYEKRLQRFRQMVWADVPFLLIDAMDGGLLQMEQYDAILIDEAHLFPPTWFKVVKRWLKRSDSMLFLAADMTRDTYSRISWKQKGLHIRGRTRILNARAD